MRKKLFISLLVVVAFVATTFSCRHSQDSDKIIVRFSDSIKVVRQDFSVVNTEGEVGEGEQLVFSVKTIEEDQFVSSWIVNDTALPNSAQGSFVYEVKKDNAKKEGNMYVLNIAFDTTTSEKIVLKIADDVHCKDVVSSMWKRSGDEVTEGQKLEFSMILSEEEACESWYINDVKVPLSSSPVLQYVVAKKDAKIQDDVAVLDITFKKATIAKLTIRFDDDAIIAVDGNKKGIFSEEEVSTADVITFTANIEDGKTIDAWFVGNKRREGETSRSFVYSPNEKDAVSQGNKKIITIKCEKRVSNQVRIDFNKEDIYTSDGMETGTMVSEGTFILFNSKFTPNSYAPTWYINDVKQPAQTLGGAFIYDNFIQTFKYTVDIKDAVDENGVKVIRVSYKTPDHTKKITITYPDDVTVIIPGVGDVASGAQVACGENLGIQAKYGFEGESSTQTVALDSWYVNGKKVGFPKIYVNPTIYSTGASALAYVYRVLEEDADESGVINISYTTHPRKDIMIEFDETIEGYRGAASARVKFESGTIIKEDTFLSFRKITNLQEYFDENFYFNGKKWESVLPSDLYLLNANDAIEENGILVLKVTTRTRPINEIKVVWADNNMKCKIGQTDISNGYILPEGTQLTFTYNLTDSTKIIRGFFTDGKDDSHILARDLATDKVEGCVIKASLEYCKKEGDSYVLRPRFQLDTKEMVTITLDSSVASLNADTNSYVKTGDKVPEGTTLKFQASVAEVHKWVVGIKEIEGGRTALPNPAVWCVNKEWAKKQDGNYVVHISFE